MSPGPLQITPFTNIVYLPTSSPAPRPSLTRVPPLCPPARSYLAPELLSGRSESGLDKADMFALGATLYELATGAPLPTGGGE